MTAKKLGLIVNPIAGMGGKVGLKGTDGRDILEQARALGAEPVSPARAVKALNRIAASAPDVEIVTYAGEMGADECLECGLEPLVVGEVGTGETEAADTRNAAKDMLRANVDLVLFAGGDGTARDVYGVVGEGIPILGIPTGVKIHSAVFATSPENAGNLAAEYLADDSGQVRVRAAEVMDIDEQAFRENRLSARLYGYARAPYLRAMIQSAKAGAATSEDAMLVALGHQFMHAMEDDVLYIIGPGTTTRHITDALGIGGTLLGVDAVRDRKLIGADLNESQLLALVDGVPAKIVVTVIGGQGYVFGRGNQQISASVIRAVGKENIVIVTTINKIFALQGKPLLVDTGDDATDSLLAGYVRVQTGPDESTMLRIAS
ncbi:MAG: ATP-NAD kinase family protein [Rhodospirillales bacterium]|nr:ATP-NAD kinase family protein [Rhodospirillales bacterium]